MGRSQVQKLERFGFNSAGNRKPRQNALPTVTGTNTVGQILTGVAGTFTGDGTITVTHQWTRNGVPIAGATALTYTLVAADSGKTVRFLSIATSRFGREISASAARSIA